MRRPNISALIADYFWQTRPQLAYWLAVAPLSPSWKVWDGEKLPMKGGEKDGQKANAKVHPERF